jgi:stress response protein YsnF
MLLTGTDGLMARDSTGEEREIVVPLCREELSISKRRLATRRVHVSAVTREREVVVNETLALETVEIERIPLGKPLDRAPEIRQEGDTLVIPVVEEVLKIERQLVLKEEIRIRRVRVSHTDQQRMKVRAQELVITDRPIQSREVTEPSTTDEDA